MECLPKDIILEYNSDTLEAVRRVHGFNKPSDMNAAIDILDEWVKQQPHFTKKDFSRRYLEYGLIAAKGSVERAKMRLDKGCTFRTLTPQFFGDHDVKEDFKSINSIINQAIVPKMTMDNNRVFILRNAGEQFDSSLCLNYFKWTAMIAEYLRMHDYADSFIVVIDYSGVNYTELASKLDIVDLRQGLNILIEGYGVRIKEIHFISQSKMIEIIIALFKQVLSAKMAARIQVHKSYEGLHKHIPKEILPKDYDGEERSVETLHNELMNVLSSKDFREYWREMCKAQSNETYRQTDKFNEQYMGMPGTFRTLSVD